MSITVEEVTGITVHVAWTCDGCGHQERLHLTMGEPKEIICPRCHRRDAVVVDAHGGEPN